MVIGTSNVVLDEFLETHLVSTFPDRCSTLHMPRSLYETTFVIQDFWRRLDDAICLAVYHKSEF